MKLPYNEMLLKLKERINKRLTESKQIIRFYDKIVDLETALIK